ncbi:hypothetical protein DFS34DRAFT_590670 [Phlyctochytrium arcticum]|nr:hypothetical protein DFS34DRAFT_590670 [Phlyctochytrium arcticum]
MQGLRRLGNMRAQQAALQLQGLRGLGKLRALPPPPKLQHLYSSSFKCERCALYLVQRITFQGKRLCADCNPESSRRTLYDANRDEMKVSTFLCQRYKNAYAVGTHASFRACGDNRRPDSVVIVNDMMIIVEADENGHRSYDIHCEWAKALEHGQSAIETDKIRRVCFIRLNSSTWPVNGQIENYDLRQRMEDLGALINKQVLDQREMYEMYMLFYPSASTTEKCIKITATELQKWFDELVL